MPQSKDTDWQIELKAKTHQCAVSGNPSHMQGYTKAQNKIDFKPTRSKETKKDIT